MSWFSPFPLKNAKAATVIYTSIPSHKKKSTSCSLVNTGLLQNLTGTALVMCAMYYEALLHALTLLDSPQNKSHVQ
jgi:hypothetical protein